jgi:hypothetical protein
MVLLSRVVGPIDFRLLCWLSSSERLMQVLTYVKRFCWLNIAR